MQDKEKKSRKEWIKTIAIIFLSIMLVLTFFANTIRNYSLPEVATQYVGPDTLSTKIRGTGTVSSQDPYNVVLKQSRKIDSVKVRVGDQIEKGQVIYVLEEGDSKELKEAQADLAKLQAEYEKNLITGQVSTSDRKAVENGNIGSIEQNQAKIDAAQKKVDQYDKEIENLTKEINRWTYNPNGDIAEIKAAKEAEEALTAWNIEKALRDSKRDAAAEALKKETDPSTLPQPNLTDEDVSGTDVSAGEENTKRQAAIDKVKPGYEAALKKYNECLELCKIADDQIAQLTYNQAANDQVAKNKVAELNKSLELAKSNKELAENNLKELVDGITARIDLNASLAEIRAKEAEIEKLQTEQGDNEVVAPVSGTILSLAKVAGETTTAEETVATIQIAGKGFTLTMSLTNEQAAMISKGDEAEVSNSWYFSDVHAVVDSIRPDKDSQGRKKIVTFNIEGESVSNGTELSLVITSRKSSNYDYVVPNSAIKHDNKGDYVYRLVEKSSPLGSRYSVERIDVQVLAEDETRSAVNGAFDGWNNYVITTASKPLSDGTLVRLKQ